MQEQSLSVGQAAAQLGVPAWKVRRVVDQIAPETPRCGQNRVLSPGTIQKLSNRLYEDGFLRERPK